MAVFMYKSHMAGAMLLCVVTWSRRYLIGYVMSYEVFYLKVPLAVYDLKACAVI